MSHLTKNVILTKKDFSFTFPPPPTKKEEERCKFKCKIWFSSDDNEIEVFLGTLDICRTFDQALQKFAGLLMKPNRNLQDF